MRKAWDCYGETFTALRYQYLADLEVMARCDIHGREKLLRGRYLFTCAPVGDSFSLYPEQAKEFSWVALHNGRLCVLPTNHLVFAEQSHTNNWSLGVPEGHATPDRDLSLRNDRGWRRLECRK
jgi:hypothetical protein